MTVTRENRLLAPVWSRSAIRYRLLSQMETARAGTAPAPDWAVTVAPFRAWRDWRLIVAEKPTRAAIEQCMPES